MSATGLRWAVPLPMTRPEELLPLARRIDDLGYDTIMLPDSVFFPESVSADYPYSDGGGRFWSPETPFVDPFVAIPAMAAVTERVRFVTNVAKVPLRNPLLLAKQIASIAVMSDNRFALGVGLGWIPEEFTWCGTNMATRGARTDEAIEIIQLVCAGQGPQWVEYHGSHHQFGRLMISPAPSQPVTVMGGGHSEPALRRAAQRCDGWISVQSTFDELASAIDRLSHLRAESSRRHLPFEISALCTEAVDAESFERLASLGVHEAQVLPWYFYGGDPEDLDVRLRALERFAADVINPSR